MNSNKKVKIFFDRLYEVIPGPYFGITSVCTMFLSVFLALFLYIIVDPSYSIFTHWISNLGIGPNGSQLIFNNGLMLVSVMMFLYLISEMRNLKNKGTSRLFLVLMTTSSLTLSIGLFMIGIWPMNLLELHCMAATFYFFGFFSLTAIYSIIVLVNKNIENKRAIISMVTAFNHIIYYFVPMIVKLPLGTTFGLTVTFLEWTTFCSQLCFINDILIQSIKSRSTRNLSFKIINGQFVPLYNKYMIHFRGLK
ncbi:MAG: DUF998 domain-containing protein [Candidatus Lokiarchaeota archaeon]|nr:DUF998 domain-containing protein [Candidatus Lokiarchaeota archaeon]